MTSHGGSGRNADRNAVQPQLQPLNIMVLGPSGSGKTVYLASLYARLSIPQPGTAFWLKVNREEQKRLNRAYSQIADTRNPTGWPDPTEIGQIKQWSFVCCVDGKDGKAYEVVEFRYLDYAGERITDPDLPEGEVTEEFERQLEAADVLLGFLDGRRILELMTDQGVGAFLYDHVANVLDVVQRSAKPVHFVITKWDLLHDRYTLRQVRNRILEYAKFQGLVQARIRQREEASRRGDQFLAPSMRLIPVSSVGTGFADLHTDPATRETTMRKRPGAIAHPFQVELPFACVLPDAFHAYLSRFSQREQQLIYRAIRPAVRLGLDGLLRELLGKLLRFTADNRDYLKLLFDRLPVEITSERLRHSAERLETLPQQLRELAAKNYELELEREHRSRQVVEDHKSAVTAALDNFRLLDWQLTRDYPESNLAMP